MNKIRKLFISSILTLASLAVSTTSENVSIAINDTEIVYDSSIYSEEVEYMKYSLKRLGYKDHKNRELFVNGYLDFRGNFALNSFLSNEGFEFLSETSKNELFKKAESTIDNSYESGFTKGRKLESTMFIYSDVANIDNMRDPFYSMGVLKNFENIVTVRPEQMSYNAKKVMDYVKTDSNVFGYINLGPNNPTDKKSNWIMADLEKLKTDIDSIAEANWHGVFIDQFGYDWGETRERQNIIVDYAHSKGLSVMVNAWFPQDALGSEIHPKGNPEGVSAHLNSNDYSLIESFYTDGNNYRADSSYIDKYLKASEYSKQTGVKISTLSYKRNASTWEEAKDDIETSFVLAHVLDFDGWWFAKYDNSDIFLYGKDSNIDLGEVLRPLEKETDNKYTAETENYIIEYYAEKTPTLNLLLK